MDETYALINNLQALTALGVVEDHAFQNCHTLANLTIGNTVTSIGDDAFEDCLSLTNVTIPESVTNMGMYAFSSCSNLHQVFFQGNAPAVDGAVKLDFTVFQGESGTVYYVPGTTGWGGLFGGWSTAQWYQPQPQILGSGHGLGVQSNEFQFTISWATNTAVVVETSANLQDWTPVITNSLVNGTNAFGDPSFTNYPQRFYRVRSQ